MDCQLIRVEDEKDMGVLFSSTLSYSYHVKEIVRKANRKARLLGINQNILFSGATMLCDLYTVLIQPHLDYACVI